MKLKLLLSLFLFFLFISCNKTSTAPERIVVDLSIIYTSTPKNQTQGESIISQVRCSGSDMCYRFLSFEINETGTRQFEIRANATYPNIAAGDVVCLQAIYYKDTTVEINTATKGQYLLRFYNQSNLFKVDTVQVN